MEHNSNEDTCMLAGAYSVSTSWFPEIQYVKDTVILVWIFFQQLMALPAYMSISMKMGLHIIGYFIYKTANNLQQITIHTSNTENSNFKHSDYLFTSLCFSMCMCLIVESL